MLFLPCSGLMRRMETCHARRLQYPLAPDATSQGATLVDEPNASKAKPHLRSPSLTLSLSRTAMDDVCPNPRPLSACG